MPERRRTPRNPVAASPLLRKGGVHERSRSGQRQIDKQVTSTALEEWRDEEGEDRKGLPGES